MGVPHLEDLPHYTWKDYQAWEGLWEIINGVPYAMTPAPTIKNQRISAKITACLENLLADCDNCVVLLPVDWKISDDTVVQPDNSIVCGASAGSAFLDTAPTVIFEILSSSTEKKDKTTKFHLYESNNVKYYCLVDPEEEEVTVYQLKNNRYQKIAEGHAPLISLDLTVCVIRFNFNKIWP